MIEIWPTRTPATSTILLKSPGARIPGSIPSRRARARFVVNLDHQSFRHSHSQTDHSTSPGLRRLRFRPLIDYAFNPFFSTGSRKKGITDREQFVSLCPRLTLPFAGDSASGFASGMAHPTGCAMPANPHQRWRECPFTLRGPHYQVERQVRVSGSGWLMDDPSRMIQETTVSLSSPNSNSA